ncbi:MAG: efflux RND transporter permease subunit [Sulfurospirillaceae bacterium]|nr:efflux RND transporter permease subunit [Sulfurospirillaceae bacterium]
MNTDLNIAGKLAQKFIQNPITPLIALAIFLFGIIAVIFTPREENPQINVPSANIIVQYAGANAGEIQNIIVEPLSRKLNEMTGVDHVYGFASDDMAVVSVRFKIGENKEDSYLKLYDRVMQNMDSLPQGVSSPLFKPIDIDEVPIVTFALASKQYDDAKLYQVAQNMLSPLSSVQNVSVVGILGGHKKQYNIFLDPMKLSSFSLSTQDVQNALNATNIAQSLGAPQGQKSAIELRLQSPIDSISSLQNLIIATHSNKVVYLRDVARIEDGVDVQNRRETYAYLGKANTQDAHHKVGEKLHQVSVYVAKKRGSNAVFVANDVLKKIETIKQTLPLGVDMIVTRNDGHKANEAVNELIFHLTISVAIIVVLLMFMLGWRESLIVSMAIPLILGVTLFIGMGADQTINRITLFALILALGLLVDDAIVVVENIHRHFGLGKLGKKEAIVFATNEIGGSTNIATFAVIFAFLPMFFVTGMMGPYMAPIPFNVPVSMIASLMIAYIFTPWATYRFLPLHVVHKGTNPKESKTYRIYESILKPMLHFRSKRYLFFGVVLALFVLSLSLPIVQAVKFKMLPGANKNTFNITVDLPQNSSLDATEKVLECIGGHLSKEAEVSDYELFAGLGGVVDFNGLLRGSSIKKGDNVGEVRVNLKDFQKRKESSAQLVSRLRPLVQSCSLGNNANIKLVEDPPGPPVKATVVAEIYGGDVMGREKIARLLENKFKSIDGVVDVDTSSEDMSIEYEIVPDLSKMALSGVDVSQVVSALKIAFDGVVISKMHDNKAKEQINIFMQLEPSKKGTLQNLEQIFVVSPKDSKQIALSELVMMRPKNASPSRISKDIKELVEVTAEMDGRGSLYALLDLFDDLKSNHIEGFKVLHDGNPRLNLTLVDVQNSQKYDLVWGGEWELTFDVFRDLGGAFGVALVLIYLLLIAYYGSFSLPGIVASAVPLTFIGVLFGHALFDIFTPTYFSATSMIGFIALAGIVVRNSLLLVDFMKSRCEEGASIEEAVIEGGATRFRPILLTALAIILASFVIVADPVWQGLAISLIFGVAVSTAMTLFVVPLLFWRKMRKPS